MYQFLHNLFEDAKRVDLTNGVCTPEYNLREGVDSLIGVLPDHLKQLYSVYVEFAKEADIQYVDAQEQIQKIGNKPKADASPEELAIIQGLVSILVRGKLVKDIFWLGVREAFPELLLTRDGIGIRKDWKVVTFPVQHSEIEIISLSLCDCCS